MIILRHKESGLLKKCTTGFSWTVLFFGWFVPLIRGDLKWAVILCVLCLIVGSFTFLVGSFVVNIVFAFAYNKIYIRGVLERGYIPSNETSKNWCIVNGLLAK